MESQTSPPTTFNAILGIPSPPLRTRPFMSPLRLHQTHSLLDALASERCQILTEYQHYIEAYDNDRYHRSLGVTLQADLARNDETTAELENLLKLVELKALSPRDPRPDQICLAFKMLGLGPEADRGAWAGTHYDRGPEEVEEYPMEIDMRDVVVDWESAASGFEQGEEVGPRGE